MDDARTDDGPILDRALELIRFLRANCEWDAKQTPVSLLPYLLEESHEVADAVAAGNDDALPGELGDLLLNIAFQIILAEERGTFGAEDVISRLEDKMQRRHPHLYGLGEKQPWEKLKARERDAAEPAASLLDGVPAALDPLSRAQRLQDRASAVGFDWPDASGAIAKVREELEEVELAIASDPAGRSAAVEEEIGDLLFSVVNTARMLDAHGMVALRRANEKFERRFRELERRAAERHLVLGEASLEELDALWEETKEGGDSVLP